MCARALFEDLAFKPPHELRNGSEPTRKNPYDYSAHQHHSPGQQHTQDSPTGKGHDEEHEPRQEDDAVDGDPDVYQPLGDGVQEPRLRGPGRLHVVKHAIVDVLAEGGQNVQRLGAERREPVQPIGFLDEALEAPQMVVQMAGVELRLAEYAAVGHSPRCGAYDLEDPPSLLVAQRLEDDVLDLVSACFCQFLSSKTDIRVIKNGF